MEILFLAIIRDRYDGSMNASFMTPNQIIDFISMDDCHNMAAEFYDLTSGVPELLTVYGTWHNFDDPLYIKLENQQGEIVVSGYGTDH